MYLPNEKVYKAAREFAAGEPLDYVRETLLECFNEKTADEILEEAELHYTEEDFGYGAFLEIVNDILGEEVYINYDEEENVDEEDDD